MAGLVDRYFDVLELLVDEPEGLPLVVIAERLDLSKSATHRLLSGLVSRSYITQDATTRHYRPTLRLTCMGLKLLSATGLVDVCQPVLDRLATSTGELARMTVAEGDVLSWVAKAQGARSGLRYDVETGGQPRLSCTATGHAWLSTLGDDEALRIVHDQGWPSPSSDQPNAPKNARELLDRLNLARQQGYAAVIDSATLGTAAVAVAICLRDSSERAVGTVSVAGPSVRIDRNRIRAFAEVLIEAALELAELWPARLYQLHGTLTGAMLRRTGT